MQRCGDTRALRQVTASSRLVRGSAAVAERRAGGTSKPWLDRASGVAVNTSVCAVAVRSSAPRSRSRVESDRMESTACPQTLCSRMGRRADTSPMRCCRSVADRASWSPRVGRRPVDRPFVRQRAVRCSYGCGVNGAFASHGPSISVEQPVCDVESRGVGRFVRCLLCIDALVRGAIAAIAMLFGVFALTAWKQRGGVKASSAQVRHAAPGWRVRGAGECLEQGKPKRGTSARSWDTTTDTTDSRSEQDPEAERQRKAGTARGERAVATLWRADREGKPLEGDASEGNERSVRRCCLRGARETR